MAHANSHYFRRSYLQPLSVGHEAMSFKPYHQSAALTHVWGAPLISRYVLSIGKQTSVIVSIVCQTVS